MGSNALFTHPAQIHHDLPDDCTQPNAFHYFMFFFFFFLDGKESLWLPLVCIH